ncbi:MAG: methyltransferase domain-containing protein [Pseudomonadota bacterium]|nr:methyltransferase domain-containing protein [Pseudomonadota bacterium]
MTMPDSENPWEWLQPHDSARFGAVILDPAERARWCRAILTGGLPLIWRNKAAPVRDLMFLKMDLRPGDNVLVIGESIEGCGFLEDIRARIGPEGRINAIDIIEQARDSVEANRRGRSGQLGTWAYDYTAGVPDGHYDSVGILQAVQHCDAWREAAREFVRVLKPGRTVMLSEIGFGQAMRNAMAADLHVEYYMDKLCRGAGLSGMDLAYYSPAELRSAFAGLVIEPMTFEWRGAELFWGRKAGGADKHD